MIVAQVAYRLMKDETFRSQVLADPRAALEQARLNLTREDMELLVNITWDSLLSQRDSQASLGPSDGPGWWDCQFNRFTPPSPSSLA